MPSPSSRLSRWVGLRLIFSISSRSARPLRITSSTAGLSSHQGWTWMWASVTGMSLLAGERLLEKRDLSGVVEVVLRDADELRVRGVGWLGHDRLVQARGIEAAHRVPDLLVQAAKRMDGIAPVGGGRLRGQRPILRRRDLGLAPAQPPQDQAVGAGEME